MLPGAVRPVLGVDFDGTLTTSDPAGPGPVLEPPTAGALAALTDYAQVFQIVLFTNHAHTDEGTLDVLEWLNRNGFGEVPLTITAEKPIAHAFLDDRNVAFTGTFPPLAELTSFQPWWSSGDSPAAEIELKGETPDALAAELAALAAAAAPEVEEAIERAVAAFGGRLAGIPHMLKTEEALAGKIRNVQAELGADAAAAAASIRDALRFCAVFPDSLYADGVDDTLELLAASAGLAADRIRNYWLPDANPRYADGTYLGVNVALQGPNGWPVELQFHTDASYGVQQVNWEFYRLLRSGELDPADREATEAQMRRNNEFVPRPAGISELVAAAQEGAGGGIPASAHYRHSDSLERSCGTCSYFGPGTVNWCGMWDHSVSPSYVCDKWADAGLPVLPGQENWDDNETSVTAALPRRKPTGPNPHPAAIHNTVLAQAYKHIDDVLAPRLAAVVQPILAQAGDKAARAFQDKATNHLTAAATGADVTPQSCMVAVYPRPDEAATLAEDEGEDPALIHVTLAYLGEPDDDTVDAVKTALARVAAGHPPLEGKVGGVAGFGDNGNGVPSIVLPSVPGLVELRQAVCQAILDGGGDYSRQHGYVPHATIAYRPTGQRRTPSRTLIGQPLHFDSVRLVRGNETVADLPLTGSKALTAAADAPPPQWSAPAPDEMIDVAALASEILKKTEPVRRAFIEAVMTPTLKSAGLSFDVRNPFVQQALASTGQKVTEIAETTRANVQKAVTAGYQTGLSIPDTAKLIKAGMQDASFTRATLIARTELAGAAGAGALASAQIVQDATNSSYVKRWMTAPGAPHPRHDTYPDLDGQTVDLDGFFEVGDAQLQFPGDPQGPPEEVCNCLAGARSPSRTVRVPR